MNVTLRLSTEMCHPYGHIWELTNRHVYVASNTDGYTTKANAKRAAKHFAEKLGLTITQTEDTI